MERRHDSDYDIRDDMEKKFQLVQTLTLTGNITENGAKAAVQATGSDDLYECFKWIMFNRKDEELVTKYSMEFDDNIHFDRDDMKKFQIVQFLQQCITEDQAKAAVQASGADDRLSCIEWIWFNRWHEELVTKYSMEFDDSMGYLKLCDDIFRSKKPWREGTTVYNGYQLLKSGLRRLLTIKMIVPYTHKHVRQLQQLVDLPPHPNIIRTIKIIEKHDGHVNKLYIVMERFQPKSMQSSLADHGYFSNDCHESFVSWTKQLITAMKHLHHQGFILENLTPRRAFLFPDNKQIKLSLIAVDENPQENDFLVLGTYRNCYQAPEVLESATVSSKSCIFSLGIILSLIWSNGIHPFGKGAIAQMYNIMTNQCCVLSDVSIPGPKKDAFLVLIKWMLDPNPEQRPSILQVAEHGSLQSIHIKRVNAVVDLLDVYIDKLHVAPKQEKLALFQEIYELCAGAQSRIAQSIRLVDFSGTALSLSDVQRIGSIIDLTEHLSVVNFSCCNLQPGALQLLDDTMKNNIKIDKLQVTGNPGLMVSDLCSGIDLCARIGYKFVYDTKHLSKEERRKLRNHVKENQLGDETSQEGSSKFRKTLIKEERLQRLYKKYSVNNAGLQRLSLDFNTDVETTNDEVQDERAKDNTPGKTNEDVDEDAIITITPPRGTVNILWETQRKVESEVVGTGGNLEGSEKPSGSTENLNKIPLNVEVLSTAEYKFNPGLEHVTAVNPQEVAESEASEADARSEPVRETMTSLERPLQVVETMPTLRGSKKKTRPLTLGERVKLKPVEKFEKFLESLNEEHGGSLAETRAMRLRKLKTMALNSDRRRFESITLKSSTNLRRYTRSTRLEVSTALLKSSKGDSGYRTRSSFSEVLSCKSSIRICSQVEKDTDERNSIKSTQAASLERIGEVESSSEQFRSCGSGASSSVEIKHEHDPNRLIEQKLEMTAMGLGALQNRGERIQSWMESAEFDHDLIEEFAARLSALIIDDTVKERKVSSIEDIVKPIIEELLQQIEIAIHGFRQTESELTKDDIVAALRESCKKSFKTDEIYPEGGSIELYGCGILFPPGAVDQRKDVTMSLDSNLDSFPESATAISPILGCKPSKFKIPVSVRITTWFSAKSGKKIWVMIMTRKSSNEEWKEIQRVQLGDRNVVEYKVSHFCEHCVAAENGADGDYHLKNDVWMHVHTANILSLFCKHEKTLRQARRRLEADNKQVIPMPADIILNAGDAIVVEIKCNMPPPPPPGMKILTHKGESKGRLVLNTRRLKKDLWSLSFEPNPHPKCMADVEQYKVSYQAELFDENNQFIDEEISTHLNFHWPLVDQRTAADGGVSQASASSQNISAPNIQAHGDVYVGGRGQSIRHDTNNEMGARPPKRLMLERGSDSD